MSLLLLFNQQAVEIPVFPLAGGSTHAPTTTGKYQVQVRFEPAADAQPIALQAWARDTITKLYREHQNLARAVPKYKGLPWQTMPHLQSQGDLKQWSEQLAHILNRSYTDLRRSAPNLPTRIVIDPMRGESALDWAKKLSVKLNTLHRDISRKIKP